MSQEQKQRRPSFTYFRREAIQTYIQHHEQTVLPQFLSTRRLLSLWLAFALVCIALIVVGYLLVRTSPVSLFSMHIPTTLE